MKLVAILAIPFASFLNSCEMRGPLESDSLQTSLDREAQHPIVQSLEVLSTSPGVTTVDPIDILPLIGELVNIGKELWPIIEAGKPVANADGFFATALPKDNPESATDFGPITRLASIRIKATNGFGANAVSLDLNISASTNGTYIAQAMVTPGMLDVLWGYAVGVKVRQVAVVRRAGYAGLILYIESTVSTPIKTSVRTWCVEVDGNGTAVIN